MRFRFYALFGFLFLLCLSLDVLMFGGLSQEADIGKAVADSARLQAPLAHTYIVLGRPIVTRIPAALTAGQNIVDAGFDDSYDAIKATPDAAIDLLLSASLGPMRALLMLCYWGAPVFLVLALLAWVFRTRRTHLIKSARR